MFAAGIDLRKANKEDNTMKKKMSTFEKFFRAEGEVIGEAKGRAEGKTRQYWNSFKASGTIMFRISRSMKNC